MKMILKVTLLAVTVSSLVSLDWVYAASFKSSQLKNNSNKSFGQNQNSVQKKVIMSADQVTLEDIEQPQNEFHASAAVARNTSLYDHQDGSKQDSFDFLLVPILKMPFGTLLSKIAYSRDLHDDQPEASDWVDLPVNFSLKPNRWEWSPPYILTFTPSITAVIPINQKTIKRDELQTSLSVGGSVGIIPDSIAAEKDGSFSLKVGVTAGQNFYAYSTDINGAVLNKYSSNQTINLGYTYKQITASFEFINKSRWTFEDNSKSSFDHTEEIEYAFNDHFAMAIGHNNTGTTLKPNGSESNVDLVDENASTVYLSMTAGF